MDNIINTIELALIIILPLLLFYQKIGKGYKSYVLYVVLLYLIWFGTYSLFHELCHLFGCWITGSKIKDVQLVPHFWEGDFKTGYVSADFKNDFQSFISIIFPYFRDVVFSITGYIILRKVKISNSFLKGLIIVIFVLSPIYDVFNNYFAFVLGARNDFNAIRGNIGYPLTHTIGIIFTLVGIIILQRVFVIMNLEIEKKTSKVH